MIERGQNTKSEGLKTGDVMLSTAVWTVLQWGWGALTQKLRHCRLFGDLLQERDMKHGMQRAFGAGAIHQKMAIALVSIGVAIAALTTATSAAHALPLVPDLPQSITNFLTGSDTAAATPADANPPYTYRKPSSDGIGKVYMGREIAQVMGHRGAGWLERSSRRQEERPWKIIDALNLHPSDIVADLGAGTGYLTFQLAPEVPQGRVLAVDIQPEMLEMLSTQQQQRGVDNVEPILAAPDEPHLPQGVDCVLMVDAYHEFEFPQEVMQSVKASLNPGGRVVLAEYRGENPFLAIKRLHKMTERQVRKELESVGFEWIKTEEQLPRQHLIFFRKPEHEKPEARYQPSATSRQN